MAACATQLLWQLLAPTSRCPSELWLDALALAAPPAPIRVVNVGANKGYVVQSALQRWAMPGLSGARWRRAILSQAAAVGSGELAFYAAGACGEGNDARKVGAVNRDGVHVHALELVPSTRSALEAVAHATGAAQYVTVHPFAASNASGFILVDNTTRAGGETNHLDSCKFRGRNCKQPIQQRVVTVDELLAGLKLSQLSHLVIDTEGFDALVLEGAAASLASHAIRVVEFEYHGKSPAKDSPT
jgi:FkbM family methyltransferase